jgi:TolB-like protein/AraC-like DNA-binding protein
MEIQPSLDDRFLQDLYQAIEINLDNEDFSVEDLAISVGLSRSMMHRKLIRLIGKSAVELITGKRLEKAKELLENNAGTTSEIAYRVGFSSPSYFARVFRKYYHLSPGDIRKICRKRDTRPEENQNSGVHKNMRRMYIMTTSILICLIVIISALLTLKTRRPLEKSIAILPFDNLGPKEENQYFADGVVEDLLNRLSHIGELKVISRTSTELFRNKGNRTIPEIGRILGVSYILEGTVQKEKDHVRINIQLVDAEKDNHIFSKQYNRQLRDVLNLQSEIAAQIASELSIVLTDQQLKALRHSRTKNLKAFEFYQMGRYHSDKRWIDGYRKGIEYYQKAIGEDPGFGLAYAGLADNYHLMAIQCWMDRNEGKSKAVDLAFKAMELDPVLAEPHAVLGDLYTYSDWEWTKSETELIQAIKLNPNYSSAHQYYSELMAILGKYDKAREHINKAVGLDPCSFVIRYFSCLFYYYKGNYNEALAENKICQDLVKDHEWAVSLEFRIHLMMNNEPAALESYRKLGKALGDWTGSQADSIYRSEGINGLFKWRLVHTKWVYEYEKIVYYLLLGENNKALELLQTSVESLDYDPMEINAPEYNILSPYPEFNAIREKLRLPSI